MKHLVVGRREGTMGRLESLTGFRIKTTGPVEVTAIKAKSLSRKPHAKRQRTSGTVVGPDVAMPDFERVMVDHAPKP